MINPESHVHNLKDAFEGYFAANGAAAQHQRLRARMDAEKQEDLAERTAEYEAAMAAKAAGEAPAGEGGSKQREPRKPPKEGREKFPSAGQRRANRELLNILAESLLQAKGGATLNYKAGQVGF